MDTSKRKLCSRKTRKIQTIKKRKVVKAKAELEQKKVPLKTIFKKVKNGDDGSSIYMIKDANEAPIQKLANPIDSDGKADITTNNDAAVESKATSSCRDTETPDFTTEDVVSGIVTEFLGHTFGQKPKVFQGNNEFAGLISGCINRLQ